MNSRLRTCLAAGVPAFGSSIWLTDPFVAEILAQAGFDYLMVDGEHSALAPPQLQNLLIALRRGDSTSLVRVADNDHVWIGQALDLGAHGVVVPHVDCVEDCYRAVSACRYAPQGSRGFGPRRASRVYSGMSTYLSRANIDVLVIAMIESLKGATNLAGILAVDGLSGIMIGPADLAASLGHVGDPSAVPVTDLVDRIAQECVEAGMPFGIGVSSPSVAKKWLEKGASFVSIQSDLLFLEEGLKDAAGDIAALRKAAAGAGTS